MAITLKCNMCGSTDAAQLVKSKRSRAGVYSLCYGCRRQQRRMRETPLGTEAVNLAVDQAPDREPAIRLRVELEHARRAGRPWSSAWPLAQSRALKDLHPMLAVSWRRAFSGTRAAWESAYEGDGEAVQPFRGLEPVAA